MPNLRLIADRLKSVRNIQKITLSMKMVSAAKFARAEKDLGMARPLGEAATHFYRQADVSCSSPLPKELLVAVTSDKGLAGGVHTSICKHIRAVLEGMPQEQRDQARVICIGDKARAYCNRYFPQNTILIGSEIGRLPPQFGEASSVASAILNCGHSYQQGQLVYNKFKSVVSYDTTPLPLFSQDVVQEAEKMSAYDSVDSDVLQSYLEFSLTSLVFYALKEGATSEQSARMTAMDNSTKNAEEMIDKLEITYNRTRQAVITGELIEIISGAAAL